MPASLYIRAMHPKTEILPNADAIAKVLARGWVGQTKIHGHRAQFHISADPRAPIIAYNRQGQLHSKTVTPEMTKDLKRWFLPKKGWNVIDGEWLKPQDKYFAFDFLKQEGQLLRKLTYLERWRLLPRDFISPHLVVLPVLRDLASCLKVLSQKDPLIEGLVFKSNTSTGFSDTSIIRCRKRK